MMGNPTAPTYESIPTEVEEAIPSSSVELVQAQVVPPSKSSIRASNADLASSLTWEDDFYKDEDDIVAVFDIDKEGVIAYQRSRGWIFVTLAIAYVVLLLWLLAGDDDDDDDDDGTAFITGMIFGAVIGLFIVIALAFCKKARAAAAGGIHIAVTSNSVRYDQEVPFLSKQIPLHRIAICTVAEKTFRTCFKTSKVNLVVLQIVGTKPVSYVGIKRAKDFQKLLVNLQQRQRQESSGAQNIV